MWKPEQWKDTVHRLVDEVHSTEELVELVADKILDEYLGSDQFAEDACDYCREQGWSSPA